MRAITCATTRSAAGYTTTSTHTKASTLAALAASCRTRTIHTYPSYCRSDGHNNSNGNDGKGETDGIYSEHRRRYSFSFGGTGWAIPYSLGFVSIIAQRLHWSPIAMPLTTPTKPTVTSGATAPMIQTSHTQDLGGLKNDNNNNNTIGILDSVGGASGGSIAALVLLLSCAQTNTKLINIIDSLQLAKQIAHLYVQSRSQSLSTRTSLTYLLRRLLFDALPVDAWYYANHRLFISGTS
jgi:hypothetical protein